MYGSVIEIICMKVVFSRSIDTGDGETSTIGSLRSVPKAVLVIALSINVVTTFRIPIYYSPAASVRCLINGSGI